MATTTNYSWTTPDNTAYVKDGASAIRTLGSSVDTTLFTALGGAYPGLRLIKKQTIGTGVTSVNVTGVFSATYDAYKIVISGGVGSINANIGLRLGGNTTGYYAGGQNVVYSTAAASLYSDNNVALWTRAGYATTDIISMSVELVNPFLSKFTTIQHAFIQGATANSSGQGSGFHNVASSFTDFTIIAAAGALTGGTIYVYGYGAS